MREEVTMKKNIIGWAVEHVLKNNKVDTRYVRSTEAEADDLLAYEREYDLFPETGSWRKVEIYA